MVNRQSGKKRRLTIVRWGLALIFCYILWLKAIEAKNQLFIDLAQVNELYPLQQK
jgi:hypothetical protein